MSEDITAYFDGKSIIPDHPLKLKVGQKLKVHIETIEATDRYPLEEISSLATDMGIENLSIRSDYR